ncbi:MAG TPA: hypothetical protein VJ866_16065 [Pyrinomonadaceae bacterium]|nr:hypothetical protein [Pyrinomonadaceae bacterium]
MPANDPLVFKDMAEREAAERSRLVGRKQMLEQAKQQAGGYLSTENQAELDRIIDLLGLQVVDPLYREVQRALRETHQDVGDQVDGKLPSQQTPTPWPDPIDLTPDEKEFAAVYGILIRERQTSPDRTKPDIYRRFSKALSAARGEFNGDKELFLAVLPILVEEGDKTNEDFVRTEHWATVTKLLVARGVAASDIHLRLKTVNELESLVGGREGLPSAISIELPDLEEYSDLEIQADNLHAIQAIYFTAMLEELKIFDVVEKLVELFQLGMLPVGKGPAGDYLYTYWRRSADRISEVERRNLYARAFGFPGGDAAQGNPNTDFNDLWLRFVSSVSSFVRQLKVDNLLRANVPVSISQEQVRKAGRDLAANLSLHGYGIAYFVATDLQNSVREFITLLSDPEIRAAYGARDWNQVIEQVSTLELGGARNGVRYRTMATAGAVIIRWLANRANLLAGSSFVDVVDLNVLRNPPPRPSGSRATIDPTDYDLFNACEQWLAVTGTPDMQVEEYAQPKEGPTLTSSPVRIPTVAKDLLESVGIQAGVPAGAYPTNGYGSGNGNGKRRG